MNNGITLHHPLRRLCHWTALAGLALAAALPAFSQLVYDFQFSNPAGAFTATLQTDGKIVLPGPTRLNADGTLDTSFSPYFGPRSKVYSAAVDEAQRIILAGEFGTLGGLNNSNLVRLTSAGQPDSTFNAGSFDWGATVFSVAQQPDGDLIVGGAFQTIQGQARTNIARLKADGTLNPQFSYGVDNVPFALAAQSDGKVLVGALFTKLAGHSCTNLGRLDSAGNFDASFLPKNVAAVNCLAVQADGKILVGMALIPAGSTTNRSLIRLNPDGSLDSTFAPLIPGDTECLAIQADGKIIAGGTFATVNDAPYPGLVRLQTNGVVDPPFLPPAYAEVQALALQPDGRLVVGSVAGAPGNFNIGRLINTDPGTQTLSYDRTNITWLRGGTAPEVVWTTFQSSGNGTDWVRLGQGERIPGGWRLSGVSLPAGTLLRARGAVIGSDYNSTSWFVGADLQVGVPKIEANDGRFGSADGTFGFTVTGWRGQKVVIQASLDLNQWADLQTNLLETGSSFFSEPITKANNRRFYRLRLE